MDVAQRGTSPILGTPWQDSHPTFSDFRRSRKPRSFGCDAQGLGADRCRGDVAVRYGRMQPEMAGRLGAYTVLDLKFRIRQSRGNSGRTIVFLARSVSHQLAIFELYQTLAQCQTKTTHAHCSSHTWLEGTLTIRRRRCRPMRTGSRRSGAPWRRRPRQRRQTRGR